MLKRIVRITLLFCLAWFLEPVLSTILPLPTERMMDGILNLEKESHHSLFIMFRYFVWVIFLALIFRFSGPFLSFALPFSKRFSVTKPMRRFQGVFAEVFLFGLIFVILGLIIAPINANNHFDDLVNKHRKKWIKLTDVKEKIDSLSTEIRDNTQKAVNFIRENRFNYLVTKTTWPLNTNSLFNNYYSIVYDYHFNRMTAHMTAPTGFAADNIATLEKYLLLHRNTFSANYPETPHLSEDVRQNIIKANRTYRPITKTNTYQAFFQKNQTLENEKREMETAKDYMDKNPGLHFKKMTEYAETDAWAEIGSLANWWFIGFKSGGWFIFILALLGYSITHITDRTILGQAYTNFMRVIEQSRFGLGGSARFAGLFEEWALLFKKQKEGLFMGHSLYNQDLTIGLEDSRHMMTIAGSRAGKGTTSIIPNLLLWKGSTLVIDPKGTNAAVTAEHRRKMDQKVFLIDPFNVSTTESACFNPLELLDPESPMIREQINIIAEALVVADPNQKEKHWDDGARTVISGMIAHLVSSPKYQNPTLSMLRDMISCQPDEQADLWADMSLNEGAGRMAKDAANRVIRGISTNEIAGIISNADKHTEWLSSPAMVKTLGSSSFQFADLKNDPTTVYLILPPEYLQTHNRFLRLFVNLMISNMSIGGRAKVPVLLLMDEFLALGRMEEVEKAFGLMAGYNLIMWPFIQDLGRLQDMYGKSVNAFIANSRAVQVYGVSDAETTEYVSNAVGDRSLNSSFKVKPDRYNNVVKLRNPSEVSIDVSADSNRQYILRAGKAPLILEKIPYYKDPMFSGMYDEDPDYNSK